MRTSLRYRGARLQRRLGRKTFCLMSRPSGVLVCDVHGYRGQGPKYWGYFRRVLSGTLVIAQDAKLRSGSLVLKANKYGGESRGDTQG